MQSKHIIGIVAVIAVIAGGIYLFTGETAQAPTGTQTNTPAEDGGTDTPTARTDQSTSTDDTDQNTDTATSAGPAATITYTEDGFEPETITIQQGQTVRFENESSRDVWPASDVHPTHTVYPESSADDCLGSSFDACEGLAQGETWSFTFTEAGEWKYHDHLRASETGTIVVE